jgi:hypothetical protein
MEGLTKDKRRKVINAAKDMLAIPWVVARHIEQEEIANIAAFLSANPDFASKGKRCATLLNAQTEDFYENFEKAVENDKKLRAESEERPVTSSSSRAPQAADDDGEPIPTPQLMLLLMVREALDSEIQAVHARVAAKDRCQEHLNEELPAHMDNFKAWALQQSYLMTEVEARIAAKSAVDAKFGDATELCAGKSEGTLKMKWAIATSVTSDVMPRWSQGKKSLAKDPLTAYSTVVIIGESEASVCIEARYADPNIGNCVISDRMKSIKSNVLHVHTGSRELETVKQGVFLGHEERASVLMKGKSSARNDAEEEKVKPGLLERLCGCLPCVKRIVLNVDPLSLNYELDQQWEVSDLGISWLPQNDTDWGQTGPDWQSEESASSKDLDVPMHIKLRDGQRLEILAEKATSKSWISPDYEGEVVEVDAKVLSAAEINLVRQRTGQAQSSEGGMFSGMSGIGTGLGSLFSSAKEAATSYVQDALDEFDQMAEAGLNNLQGRLGQQHEDLNRAGASLNMAEDRLANAMKQLEIAQADLDESDVGFCTELARSMKDAVVRLFPEDEKEKAALTSSKVDPSGQE